MVVTIHNVRKKIEASRSNDMLRLLETGLFSDFEIHCGEHVFKVHRAVILQGCEYFQTLTAGQFKEGMEQKVVFADDEPAVVARMIYFLYTGRLSIKTPLADCKIDLFRHVDESMYSKKGQLYCASVYAIAVRLSISDLVNLAVWEYRNVNVSAQLCDRESLVERYHYIYASTPSTCRALKDRLVRKIQYAVRMNLDIESVSNNTLESLQEVIHRAPDLGFDLLTMPLSEKSLRCLNCRQLNPILFQRCTHVQEHKYLDDDCLKENIKTQECFSCGAIDVFDKKKGLTLKNMIEEERNLNRWWGSEKRTVAQEMKG